MYLFTSSVKSLRLISWRWEQMKPNTAYDKHYVALQIKLDVTKAKRNTKVWFNSLEAISFYQCQKSKPIILKSSLEVKEGDKHLSYLHFQHEISEVKSFLSCSVNMQHQKRTTKLYRLTKAKKFY